MAAARTSVVIFLLTSITIYEAKRGPQEVEETRKHDPARCMIQAGEASATRVEDMGERGDNCCATEEDAQCGGDYELDVSGETCSKQGAKLTLYEFKCYPDESKLPLAVVIAIVACVGLCCAFASACRFTWVRFQAPTVPKEQAMFSHSERKSLTLSGSASGTPRHFGSRTSDTAKRQSMSSDNSDQHGPSDNLPTVLTSKGNDTLKGQTVGKPVPVAPVQPSEPQSDFESVEV